MFIESLKITDLCHVLNYYLIIIDNVRIFWSTKMTYEPGVLVRRQQREYPPELRREIALAALEVGNNREVARLYSERLGYTVNESTVRGIKKRSGFKR